MKRNCVRLRTDFFSGIPRFLEKEAVFYKEEGERTDERRT